MSKNREKENMENMINYFRRGKSNVPELVEKSEQTKLYEELYDARVASFERKLQNDKLQENVKDDLLIFAEKTLKIKFSTKFVYRNF